MNNFKIKKEKIPEYSPRFLSQRKISALVSPLILPIIHHLIKNEIQRREQNGEIHCYQVRLIDHRLELTFSLESKYYPGPEYWIEEFYLYTSFLVQEKFGLKNLWE